MELFLNDKLGKITLEVDKVDDANKVLILAHGAGASMHHPFMVSLAQGISTKACHVVRFNFPYIEQGRKAPGSPKDAIETWRLVINEVEQQFPNTVIFISGKSYGGRMASHLLAESKDLSIKGIIYFGFPLHAPGKDAKDRADHLGSIEPSQLFIQGTKDKLANIEMMREVVSNLKSAEIKEIESGDHSFNVPKSAGISKDQMILNLASIATDWMNELL